MENTSNKNYLIAGHPISIETDQKIFSLLDSYLPSSPTDNIGPFLNFYIIKKKLELNDNGLVVNRSDIYFYDKAVAYINGRNIECAIDVTFNWRPPHLAKFIVLFIVELFLVRKGIISLHSSSVGLNGSALLFSSPSRTGKTTLIYNLLCCPGFSYIADDTAFISEYSGCYFIHPFNVPVLFVKHDIENPDENKTSLKPKIVMTEKCPINSIFFNTIVSGEITSVEKVDNKTSYIEILKGIRTAPYLQAEDKKFIFNAVGELAESVRCCNLFIGGNMNDAVKKIMALNM